MNITPITPAIFYDDAEFRRRSRLRRDSDLRNTMFNELARTMVNRQRVNQSINHLGFFGVQRLNLHNFELH